LDYLAHWTSAMSASARTAAPMEAGREQPTARLTETAS
jgi:hypothetical protein